MKVVFSSMVLLFLHFLKTTKAQEQVLYLYSEPNSNGNYVKLPEVYTANLADLSFDDQARSICVTGIWLLYEDKQYNPAGHRGVEYFFGRDNNCSNLMTLQEKVSSVRYAGSAKDYRSDSFTLYEHVDFQGREEYIVTQAASLNLNKGSGSIIITGNSHWTIFDQTNYRGNSICLYVLDPGSSTPRFIEDFASSLEIDSGAIKSVRKGCSGQREEGKFGVQ